MRSAAPTPSTTSRPEAVAPPLDDDDDAESGPTAAEVVLLVVTHTPGLRGVEIVAEAAKTVSPPLKERTVRTALHRLKTAAKIVNVDERWYLPDAAPPPISEMRG